MQTLAMMVALRLTSLEELFELQLPEETKKQFQKESTQWIRTRDKPESVIQLMMDNAEKRKNIELARFLES